ncbi:MAG: Holliday junction branch migration protein RuvA [Candidatus Marinimicrobia bacterium]|nr:Holliday junction branch migration protein RuvA [Candidatus Neomarinimicrobiota bacterium]|tara:strand:+ start:288 stop:869 length:582 start_codon:yes stop_codon:yes gene_type:complete
MIVHIEGKIIIKNPDSIIVDVNGLGYECSISNYTYNELPEVGSTVFLNTYLQISENSHSLYGFLNLEEKSLFVMLISINGIGPKKAMPILSSSVPNDIINRIVSGDVSMMSSLPGVGPKTAKRIIIELKDKLSDYSASISDLEDTTIINDALNALTVLGYSGIAVKKAINEILGKNPDIETSELIKRTLNKIK